MDAITEICLQDNAPAYSTSKQVQAWFLRRSRGLWKKKYAELKVQSKRLRQRVADVTNSRAEWRSKAETARREAEELRTQNAAIRVQLEALTYSVDKKKLLSSCPS